MPVFQYVCPQCGKKFDELVSRYDAAVQCPVCGAQASREWSGEMFSSTGKPAKKCSGHCATCSGCK
ncbi:MAG TPA: zinc ribbon domain-containing protein [Firmicutes bacterium]|nr:zinc ribbon domain-containing protein [Bacillota bacterium]